MMIDGWMLGGGCKSCCSIARLSGFPLGTRGRRVVGVGVFADVDEGMDVYMSESLKMTIVMITITV